MQVRDVVREDARSDASGSPLGVLRETAVV